MFKLSFFSLTASLDNRLALQGNGKGFFSLYVKYMFILILQLETMDVVFHFNTRWFVFHLNHNAKKWLVSCLTLRSRTL